MNAKQEQEEAELIGQIVAGNTALFRRLVERYKDVSLSLACSLIKDPDEAQDVLQDAFIRAFRYLPRFNFRASFSTWLYRIVVNTCHTALEKKKNRKTDRLEQKAGNIPLEGNSSYEHLRDKERAGYIQEVLGRMKPKEALVLRLYYLAEQSTPEIAEITDLSTANVKVILHRARESFRSDLERRLGKEKTSLL